MATAELIHNLDMAQVKMAIFWKMLNELDVYTTGKVQTISGEGIPALLDSLQRSAIPVEVMD